MKRLVFLFAFLLSGCLSLPTPEPTASAPRLLLAEENPYAPQPTDDALNRAGVILTSIHLSERVDLDPTRVEVIFSGSMPGVCNELRVEVELPDNAYRVSIKAYSVIDPKLKCENVFQQFEAAVLLGRYSPGRYDVWVNERLIGDFISYLY